MRTRRIVTSLGLVGVLGLGAFGLTGCDPTPEQLCNGFRPHPAPRDVVNDWDWTFGVTRCEAHHLDLETGGILAVHRYCIFPDGDWYVSISCDGPAVATTQAEMDALGDIARS